MVRVSGVHKHDARAVTELKKTRAIYGETERARPNSSSERHGGGQGPGNNLSITESASQHSPGLPGHLVRGRDPPKEGHST